MNTLYKTIRGTKIEEMNPLTNLKRAVLSEPRTASRAGYCPKEQIK